MLSWKQTKKHYLVYKSVKYFSSDFWPNYLFFCIFFGLIVHPCVILDDSSKSVSNTSGDRLNLKIGAYFQPEKCFLWCLICVLNFTHKSLAARSERTSIAYFRSKGACGIMTIRNNLNYLYQIGLYRFSFPQRKSNNIL